MSAAPSSVEDAVRSRYSAAAARREEALCCPTACDPALLAAIPEEVIERDYGCGDPTRWLRPGETVLDLGSGSGKACFLAAQVVGAAGRVIGIDSTAEMLALARSAAPEVARRVGFANVEFRRGRIEDLRLDLAALDAWLARHPVRGADELPALEAERERIRGERPLVADASVDVVVSNCVLNLVHPGQKRSLFAEIARVLRRGGRAVISDICSDEDVPEELQRDPELWSGCVSGALREDRFLYAFEDAGLHGVEVLSRDEQPWRTVQGIEFRSVTVRAWKGKEGPCVDRLQAVVYRGPFREVRDDDGHVFRRGARVAVCEKTFTILTKEPYGSHFVPVPPRELPAQEESRPFPCGGGMLLRDPKETKGLGYAATTEAAAGVCGQGEGCC